MAAIGIGVIWVSYLGGLYGYCLFKGYNITMKQLVSPSWPGIEKPVKVPGHKPADPR